MFDHNQMLSAQAYDPRYAGFSRTLEIEMENYGRMTSVDGRFAKMNDRITDIRDVMLGNVDTVINRGDDVGNLLQRTEIMVNDSNVFQDTAKKVKVKMWWKNVAVWVIGTIILLVNFFIFLKIQILILFFSFFFLNESGFNLVDFFDCLWIRFW